jgi:hypothetical protein
VTFIKSIGVTAAAVAGVVAASEYLHWRSSKWYLPVEQPSGGPCSLIVLGYPTRLNGEPRRAQVWRVQLAKRAFDELAATKVVFSGGPSKGRPAEGEAMAALAHRLGMPPDGVEVEIEARTTWQNVQFCLPLVGNSARVAIVSDPLHAARARRYLMAQDPEVGRRLVSAGEYQFMEHCWLKIPCLVHEIYVAVRGTLRANTIDEAVPPTLSP